MNTIIKRYLSIIFISLGCWQSIAAYIPTLATPTTPTPTSTPSIAKSDTKPEPSPVVKAIKNDIMIRVLLNELDAVKKSTHEISCPEGFMIELPEKTHHKFCYKHEKILINVQNNTIYLRDSKLTYRKVKNNHLSITPLGGILHFDKKSYHGALSISIDAERGKMLLINRLSLDNYIYSVLRFESLSHWPLEVQKVQAIASRSYAFYQIMQQHKKKGDKDLYDIKNTNFHQVYHGSHSCTHLWQAVHDTHNLILTHKGTVALTMFDICCGGVIPAKMKKADSSMPYLYRDYACTYCKSKKAFTWKTTFQTKDFLAHLRDNPKIANKVKELKTIDYVTVGKKDKAGLAQTITLSDGRKKVTLMAHDIKRSLKAKVKSLALDVKKNKNQVEFSGNGFGHLIGLCQLGAHELVARGWKFNKILSFYYPETSLKRLK